MVRRRASKKPTKNFYILIAAIAVGVFLLVFFLNYNPSIIAENGKIAFETTQNVVLARDEKVITEENYGKVTYIASEGEYVTEGAEIAEIYKIGYNDKVLSELLDVQTKIGQYQENTLLGDVLDQNLIAINTSIEQKAEAISLVVAGKSDADLLQLEKELKRLQEDKLLYLKEAVNPDSQLEEYYAQEEELASRVESWKQVVTAPEAGVVSFYFDGCESLLNANHLKQLSIKDINDILNGSALSQIKGTDTDSPLCRIVNSYKWYLLIVSSTSIPEFESGQEFYISFDEYLDKQYTGKIVGIREEDSGFVYAMEINDDIGPLISTRRTTAYIYTMFEGTKVPSSCIKSEEDTLGVYVKHGEKTEFVPIDILIERDGECIIEPQNDNYTISPGMEIKP